MRGGVETPTALVPAAECSVPSLLSFAIMRGLALMQNLREKYLGVPICILFKEGREKVGHRAQLAV